MKVIAYAKINLTLDIHGRRVDGYHEISTVMQRLTLADILDIDIAETAVGGKNEIAITCDYPYLPCEETNLCYKACELFLNTYGITGYRVSIALNKNIPIAAGLGGGSSDGAETLKALNILFRMGADEKTLEALAVKLGADMPFFIRGGTQLAEGIGEKLKPLSLPYPGNLYVAVAKPESALFSGQIYSRYDKLPEHAQTKPSTESFLKKMSKGDISAFGIVANMLEPAASPLCGKITELKRLFLSLGAAGAEMTGSGSSVYGIFTDETSAKAAEKAAKELEGIIFGTTCRFI